MPSVDFFLVPSFSLFWPISSRHFFGKTFSRFVSFSTFAEAIFLPLLTICRRGCFAYPEGAFLFFCVAAPHAPL